MNGNSSWHIITLPSLVTISLSLVMFSVCHVIKQDHLKKGQVTYVRELDKVIHNPTKFDDHRHSGIGDVLVLVCHVILQVDVIKKSCDLMDRNPSRKVTILSSLVTISTSGVETKWFSVVTWSSKSLWWKRHITSWLGAFTVSHHPTRFGGHR